MAVVHPDYVDRLGHGTAVTAAIREKASGAQIFAIKVFWRSLATNVETLVRGIELAAARGADVINLSLGTNETRHQNGCSTRLVRRPPEDRLWLRRTTTTARYGFPAA